MRENNQTIYIVDDDADVREALRLLFESVRFSVETYEDAPQFLANYNSKLPGCLIVDVRMPLMSGLTLLEHLKKQKSHLPVIMITGFADIEMVIRAMKAGAADFILKPINDQCLLELVQKHTKSISTQEPLGDPDERIQCLSQRELDVIRLMLEGKLNKEIAYELSISMSTVETHRARIMQKMKAKNLAQVIKLCLQSSLFSSIPLE